MSSYEWFAATATALGVALVLIALSLMIDGHSEAKLIFHERPAEFSSSPGTMTSKDGALALQRRTDIDDKHYLK